MTNFLNGAFKKLDVLNEDTFDLTHDGIEELKDFKETDKVDDTMFIIDPDAKDEDELEDSYIGKVILDCDVCHSLIYKDKEDVHIDEETQEANADEECPYCFTTGGFKIIGEVKEFDGFHDYDEEDEDEIEVEDEFEIKDKKIEEACKRKNLKKLDRKHTKDLKENIGKDLDRFQKWVDYDMKRYGEISERTNDLISKAGLEVVKDKYGDYQVIAKDFKDESLDEDFKEVEITTDDSRMKMTSDEDGKVTVTTEKLPTGEEVIAPLSDEVEDEIEIGSEEEVEEPSEDEEDIEFDDVEDFDELGESYLKKVYENVNSFKTTKCTEKGNKIMLEGVISFNSGKRKKTSFIFEAKDSIGNGRIRFIGENKSIASGKPYLMTAVLDNRRLFTESLKYNYATTLGRVRGEVKR